MIFLTVLTVSAAGAELPEDLLHAVPEGAETVADAAHADGVQGFTEGLQTILADVPQQAETILRQRVRGAAMVLLTVILCAAAEGFSLGTTGRSSPYLPMAGALTVTALTAGSLDSLIGLGAETIGRLRAFSKVLLPTLAAATAASGGVTTAAVHQVTTVFFVDLLLNLVDGVLMPMVYLYIGTLTAAGCMPGSCLEGIAAGLKGVLTWLLKTALLGFTLYLSVVRVISGAADGAAVKLTKAAISGVVPVVGGIIAEAAETVLAGAGMLKNTIGIFGMLVILAACVYPFLQLGIQYLLYQLTAFLAGAVGAPTLCKLIRGLSGAFGLVLGMTGSCAVLLLVSVLSSVAAVVP